MRGRYLKSAEKACAAKARFDTQETAERTSEYRYRAYQCPICHQWHLTSHGGAAGPPSAVNKPAAPLARLSDLEWKELKPRGEPSRLVKPISVPKVAKPTAELTEATVKSLPDRHHRVLLVKNLRLVKSDAVNPELRGKVRIGDVVQLDGLRIVMITDSSSD